MRALSVLAGLSLALFPFHPASAVEVDAEDFKRLVDRITAQDEAIEAFRGSVQELRGEMSRLRSENDRLKTQINAPRNFATQEQITKLGDQLREVEKNRTADKQQILDALEKLKAAPPIVIPPAPSPGNTHRPSDKAAEKPSDKPTGSEKVQPTADAGPDLPTEFYEHTLAEGETLGAVIDAYNKQNGLKVRLAHVLKANPSIKDPKRLRSGQKIRIPAVK
jgi:hypothetical protein